MWLSRGGGERRKLVDVARVVLDDDRRLEVLLNLLDPIQGGERLGSVVVEARDAIVLIVLVEVRQVSAQDDRALLLQAHEQRLMAGRVTGRSQDHHGSIAEYVLVCGLRFDLASATDPRRERADVWPPPWAWAP